MRNKALHYKNSKNSTHVFLAIFTTPDTTNSLIQSRDEKKSLEIRMCKALFFSPVTVLDAPACLLNLTTKKLKKVLSKLLQ